jgi:FtsP/CotA-like multicopper oxidase with cupredoxin domain
LINGKQTIEYPDFKPGEKVRVRVINGGASTSFDDFGVKTQYLFHQTAMT